MYNVMSELKKDEIAHASPNGCPANLRSPLLSSFLHKEENKLAKDWTEAWNIWPCLPLPINLPSSVVLLMCPCKAIGFASPTECAPLWSAHQWPETPRNWASASMCPWYVAYWDSRLPNIPNTWGEAQIRSSCLSFLTIACRRSGRSVMMTMTVQVVAKWEWHGRVRNGRGPQGMAAPPPVQSGAPVWVLKIRQEQGYYTHTHTLHTPASRIW